VNGVRCLRCILIFAAAGLLAAAIAGAVTIAYLADWLVRSDPLEPADAIVVLAGAPERPLYAADLYRQRYAAKVLVSRPALHPSQPLLAEHGIELQREEAINIALLRARRVPDSAIELFGAGARSTVAEMETLKGMFAASPTRLLIVTSALHTRRARLVARRAFQGTGIVPIVVATPYERFPQPWWADQDTARRVVLEVVKTTFYLVGGRYRAADPV
jgi:uncharacterized SAM-binding protein YcdF (DUF218 family)